MANTLGPAILKELEMEAPGSRKCIERVPGELYDWKPHEKSMPMGYLTLMIAEIPRWITTVIQDPEINFGTFKHESPKTAEEMAKHFDENMALARKLLPTVSDDALEASFALKAGDKVLASSTKKEMLYPLVNHWVHHRGQLTVYMRLNNIPVPALYGPSADEQSWSL